MKCIDKNNLPFSFTIGRTSLGNPWHFDRSALYLSEVDGNKSYREISPCLLPIWTRIYDLPFKCKCNKVNAESLGNKIGTSVCFDPSDGVDIEKSVWIRVLLDVRRPLKDKINLNLRGGVVKPVTVKYENLPMFCFIC